MSDSERLESIMNSVFISALREYDRELVDSVAESVMEAFDEDLFFDESDLPVQAECGVHEK